MKSWLCGKAECSKILALFALTWLIFRYLANSFIAPTIHLFINRYSQATAQYSPKIHLYPKPSAKIHNQAGETLSHSVLRSVSNGPGNPAAVRVGLLKRIGSVPDPAKILTRWLLADPTRTCTRQPAAFARFGYTCRFQSLVLRFGFPIYGRIQICYCES